MTLLGHHRTNQCVAFCLHSYYASIPGYGHDSDMQHINIVSQSTHSSTFVTAMWQWITWREVIAVLLITAIGINYILDSERQLIYVNNIIIINTQCHDCTISCCSRIVKGLADVNGRSGEMTRTSVWRAALSCVCLRTRELQAEIHQDPPPRLHDQYMPRLLWCCTWCMTPSGRAQVILLHEYG